MPSENSLMNQVPESESRQRVIAIATEGCDTFAAPTTGDIETHPG